jgi:hypothetical protein
LTKKKSKRKNKNQKRFTKGKVAPAVTGTELVRGLMSNLLREGLHDHTGGFESLVIHDHTQHRIITDKEQTAKHFKPTGKMVKLEVYVPKRNLAGCNDMRLVMRTLCDTLTRDQIVEMFCENRHWIINPQETANTLIGMMQDGIIDRTVVDLILDIHHPVWNQISWKEDTQLEKDFIEAWINNPGLSNDEEEALRVFNEKKPNYLVRKEETLSITVTDNLDKEQTYKFSLALEKAELDSRRGRSRYFLADARTGSPFRSQYLHMSGWKQKSVDIRGKPSSLNYMNLRGPPTYLEEEIQLSRKTTSVGDIIGLEQGESLLDRLQRDGTITL